MQRAFDVVLSATLFLLFSPVMLAIIVAVFLTDGWPVFYSQERVGRNFKTIRILKFRTMRPGALEPFITVAGDTRVTRLGRWLRSSKLDELPQLWNVLRGDMSLVGPRPEVAEFVELYRKRYEKVLSVRPGITDPASIAFVDEEALLAKAADPVREYRERVLPAKLDLADRYIETRSALGDFKLLFATAAAVLHRRKKEAE